MTLWSDLNQGDYLDATYGVVSNAPNMACDNYNLFSAETMLIAGWIDMPEYATFFGASEVEPGLIVRYPGRKNDGISQDELIGAATISMYAADRIYQYGQSHWWVFNPDKAAFSWNMWLGRFLDLKPYVKQASGRRLNIVDQILWSVLTLFAPLSATNNTSGKLLKWAQIRKMENHYWICDAAIKFFRWRMMRQYPGGVKAVMAIYFGQQHPLTIYAKTDFN